MRYTTFCSGKTESGQFVQFRIAGTAKPATIINRAAMRGITAELKAEAVSFDGSGKGRHIKNAVPL
ncbi:MAG: hypothetical protein ACO3F9_13605 [Burkholderiales bacterium]